MTIVKLKADSVPSKIAGLIAGVVKEGDEVELQGVGAGAVNQGVKAVAIARGYLAPSGIDIKCIPAFVNIEIDGLDRTAIKLIIVR